MNETAEKQEIVEKHMKKDFRLKGSKQKNNSASMRIKLELYSNKRKYAVQQYPKNNDENDESNFYYSLLLKI